MRRVVVFPAPFGPSSTSTSPAPTVRSTPVAAQTPVLVDGMFHGQPRKMLMQTSRNGYFFVLDRTTGESLLADLHRAVDAAGGLTAPSAAHAVATTWNIRFSLPAEALVNGARPLPLLDELRGLGDCQVRAVTRLPETTTG